MIEFVGSRLGLRCDADPDREDARPYAGGKDKGRFSIGKRGVGSEARGVLEGVHISIWEPDNKVSSKSLKHEAKLSAFIL